MFCFVRKVRTLILVVSLIVERRGFFGSSKQCATSLAGKQFSQGVPFEVFVGHARKDSSPTRSKTAYHSAQNPENPKQDCGFLLDEEVLGYCSSLSNHGLCV